jgi:HAD superfamily hydrolase (TIGR01484 family)
MRYLALATDYDGTIASHGTVFPETLASLKRLADSGRHLILVTGRDLEDLLRVFPQVELFERVVAENGALVYDPRTKQETLLCEQPDPAFVQRLHELRVDPLRVGRAIVATWTPAETVVLEVIKEMGLELQVIFNKGAVMVLPSGVNKSTGLACALRQLELSSHNVVGVGDAENDHAFLQSCECSVAVANALDTLKERCDLVTRSDHGAGVEELIEEVLADDLVRAAPRLTRHEIVLAHRVTDAHPDPRAGSARNDRPQEIRLPPYGGSILVAGPSQSGKSSAVMGLVERIAEKQYQFCLIDPEGDYESFGGALSLGDPKHPAGIDGAMKLLVKPEENVTLNLLGIALPDRPLMFAGLLPRLLELRARTGRPHWLVIDEAHHLLPASWMPAPATLPQEMQGTVLITTHPEKVARAALEAVTTVVALGNDPMDIFEGFGEAAGVALPFSSTDFELRAGEAAVWRVGEPSPIRARTLPGTVDRRRHTRKYAEGELPPERSFWFRGPDGKLNLRAYNLVMFAQMASGVDEETWEFHRRGGDYSRWIREFIKDDVLAADVEAAERSSMPATESRAQILEAIQRRYTLPG